MEKKSKKSVLIGVTSLFLVMLILIGLTYAYYRTRIIGNNNETSISVDSKNIEIIYSDGTGALEIDKVLPGYTNEDNPKTFAVTNTGDGEVNYALYLEDVVNGFVNGIEERGEYNDWTYKITCTPNCNGTNDWTDFPKLSEMIATNIIAKGETQTYTVVIKYADSDEDQSADMGASIKGKFQIYAQEEVVDIEGTIENYEEGDYVQINSIEKKSQIVDGKYKLSAVEIGEHTLKVMSKEGTKKGSTNIVVEKGSAASTGSNKIIIDDNSKTAILNITNISTNLGIEIKNVDNQPAPKILLYDAILRDNEVKEYLTIPGQIFSSETEAVLTTTQDDDGTSYYFRGNIQNNYVTYSNMCWRIVRIQGNEDIKLVLADWAHPCGTENGYSTTDKDSAFVADETGNAKKDIAYKTSSSYSSKNYLFANSEIPNVLNDWSQNNNLDMSKLVESEWCNDTAHTENDSAHNWQYFASFTRLDAVSTAKPSLKCNTKGMSGTSGIEAISTKYTNKLGILSADEIAFAGGISGKLNYSFYLYNNANDNKYLTLSPSVIENNSDVLIWITGANYSLHHGFIGTKSYSVRPAVVLKKDVTLSTTTNYTQDGTVDKPYVIG